MQDKFGDMRTFATVVEAQGFAAAAARLGIAKSGVSRRIKELEVRLEARLVNRTTRSFRLTEAGTLFYERCRRILEAVAEAEDLPTGDEGPSPSGTLRVAAPSIFGSAHFIGHIGRFNRLFPRIALDLDLTDQPLNLVAEGYDLAIRVTRLHDSTLVARHLLDVRYLACASPRYLAQHGEPRHPDQLRQHAGLRVSGAGAPDYWQFREHGSGGGTFRVQVPTAFQSSSAEAVCEYAVLGHGIAMLPQPMAAPAIAAGSLRAVLEDFEPPATGMYALFPQSRYLPAKTRALVDFLVEAFRRQDGEHPAGPGRA
ncbi:MAG: LysR family transcriptional regulator [Pseudomonadota bacterium]